MKPRNMYAVLASKRKAGSHRKSNKALRRRQKTEHRSIIQRQNSRLLTDLSGFESLCSDHIRTHSSLVEPTVCLVSRADATK